MKDKNLYNIFRNFYFASGLSLLLILIFFSIFNVAVDEQVIITQFGRIIDGPKTEPGLHLKIPFIQKVHYLPQHIVHEWKSFTIQAQSTDNAFLEIKIHAMWKISDPIKYFQNVKEDANIPVLFNNIFQSAVKNIITSQRFSELVIEQINSQKDFIGFKQERIDEIAKLTEPRLGKLGIELFKLEVKVKKR